MTWLTHRPPGRRTSALSFILIDHPFTTTSSCAPQDPHISRLPSQSSTSHFCCWTTEVQDSSPYSALQRQGELCGKWMTPVLCFGWWLCGRVSRLVVNLICVDVCPQNNSFLLKISSLFSPIWRSSAWMSRLGNWQRSIIQQITLGWYQIPKGGKWWNRVEIRSDSSFPWCLYKEQIRLFSVS